MKALKRCSILILAAIIFLVSFSLSYLPIKAFSGVPDTIRVGIRYGSDTPTAALVTADEGFVYGWASSSGEFNQIGEISKGSSIYVRKDTFYSKGIYLPQEESSSSKSEFGPYRVQIGDNLSTSSNAQSMAESYSNSLGIHCYVAYRSGWKVLTGDFKSKAEATNYINDVLKPKDLSLTYSEFSPTDTTLVIQDNNYKTILVFDGGQDMRFQATASFKNNPEVIQTGARKYRGRLEFRRFQGSHITVINVLSFEQYLYSVVSRELGYATTPHEAWKAQAIACRTFAYNSILGSKHRSYDFDICSTSCCQNYAGYSSDTGYVYELKGINEAVDETKGLIVTYNGKPAQIYYSSSNGGYTEATENVWSAELPYLKTYKDPYDPVRISTYTITAKEASDFLKSNGYDVGDLRKIEIRRRSESGRVLELYVEGSKGSKTITKSSTRRAFYNSNKNSLNTQMYAISTDIIFEVVQGNWNQQLVDKLSGKVYNKDFLKSKTYTVRNIPDGGIAGYNNYYNETIIINDLNEKLTFVGKGNGHGVGMSQLGAMEMARQGKKCEEILQFYFKGTRVE